MKQVMLLFVLAFAMSTGEHAHGQSKEQLIGKDNFKDTARWMMIDNQYVLREVGNAFIAMRREARKEGIELAIVSGFRSFERQQQIWNKKWSSAPLKGMKDKQRVLTIMQYSSMPGTSRHHWGTDIDINSVEPTYFDKAYGRKVYGWLKRNAEKFGFIQPYTAGRTKGYSEEKWHWSYEPLSQVYLKKYISTISNDEVLSYANCKHIEDLNIIENWVKL